MWPIFTMQYSEFKSAEIVCNKIKNASIFIPVSQQEKGIDFLLRISENGTNKFC